MNKLPLLFSALFFIVLIPQLQAQKYVANSKIIGVCYAGNKINRIYIPPPEVFYKRAASKSGGSIKIYSTGFSSLADTALQYAASILRTMLPADTKLTILANWQKISTAGVLANSNTTGYAAGWGIDALNPRAFYPVALAEKISGKSLNEDQQGDVVLNVNSSVSWYLGTDGNTPTNKYDLVTVALHEICHGLGFFGSMNADTIIGYYGIASVPVIYDTFVEDITGNKLTDTLKYPNYSKNLLSQYTGGSLFFNGPLLSNYKSLNNYSTGTRAKLFAPSKWDAGSSISHLEEQPTTLQIDALMTPFIDRGEAIHDPGKLTMSILGDLGWINTRIIHKPPIDTESHLTEIVLSATIQSDTLYNHNKISAIYSFDNFKSSSTVIMTSPNSDNSYNTTIGITSFNTKLQYYFSAEDCFKRVYRSPSLYDSIRYQVYIGIDTVKPTIIHTPEIYYLETIDTINFKAAVTDNLGIDSVYVEYKLNDNTSEFIRLKAGVLDTFSNFLYTKPDLLTDIDSLQYRIFAVDTALIPNTSVLPKTGFFNVKIEHLLPTISSYSTDFTNSAGDFFNDGFSVSKPTGFSKYGLNSKHPYESPEDNNKSINYTALLRHPLKFSESGMLINFNELVLVEPGETGSVFGSSDFYDYVIVEGSKNFGETWFALADGYDSRLIPSWLTAYNSSIVGQNSTFVGTESMLVKHTIFYRPSDKISAGDTVLVRFRLFSDPFANGWGWVIEDLKIDPLIDAIEKVIIDPVKVYPNPGSGLIRISFNSIVNENRKPVHYGIFNSSGICIKNDLISGDSDTEIDISNYPTGIYIILLYRDDGITTIKYSLMK
jgi:hypothetical protein